MGETPEAFAHSLHSSLIALMFDVGFSELLVIGVVALVVIGPERLPKVARTAGLLLGRLQRYVNDVKADINREMQLDELKKMQEQMTDQMRSMETSVTKEMSAVEESLNQSIAPQAAQPMPQAAQPTPLAAEPMPQAAELTPQAAQPLQQAAEPTPLVTESQPAAVNQLELGLDHSADKRADKPKV